MTHYGYLPYQMVKRVTASEADSISGHLSAWYEPLAAGKVRELEQLLASSDHFQKRIQPLSELSEADKAMVDVPCFLECNLDRFPSWRSMHDLRLD